MIAVSIWGFCVGNLEVALSPVNANGGFCGHNYNGNDNKDYDYLFIYNLTGAINQSNNGGNFWHNGVCVNECPSEYNQTITCSE